MVENKKRLNALLLLSLSSLALANSPEIPQQQANSLESFYSSKLIFSTHWINYERYNDIAIVEGDIVLGDAETIAAAQRAQTQGLSVKFTAALWPNGIVPYQVSEQILHSKLYDRIMQAIEHWNTYTPIQMIARTADNQHLYEDYVEFTLGLSCSSYIGRRGRRQFIWVTDDCKAGNILHEIGHTVGLLHEHVRSDRDAYIEVLWENIEPGKDHNFIQQLNFSNDLSEYDYQSIMHYGERFFSKNGQPTLQPLANDVRIGQRETLSQGDIQTVAEMYGLSTTALPSPTALPDAQNDAGGGGMLSGFIGFLLWIAIARRSRLNAA